MFRFLAILFTTAGLSGMLALPLFAQDLPRPVKLMTVADQDHRVGHEHCAGHTVEPL